jgi:hypothetical protein
MAVTRMGCFLSVDPVIGKGALRRPQMWNRYAYVAHNPLNRVDAPDVFSDSGCVMFLPLTSDLPSDIRERVEEILRDDTGVVVEVPPGYWSFFYEQHDGAPPELFRNIVVRRNDQKELQRKLSDEHVEPPDHEN